MGISCPGDFAWTCDQPSDANASVDDLLVNEQETQDNSLISDIQTVSEITDSDTSKRRSSHIRKRPDRLICSN